MYGKNPETGAPSEEDAIISSEEKEEKITVSILYQEIGTRWERKASKHTRRQPSVFEKQEAERSCALKAIMDTYGAESPAVP